MRSVCWEVERFCAMFLNLWFGEGRGWNENGLMYFQSKDMLEIYRGADKEKLRMALCHGCLSLSALFV